MSGSGVKVLKFGGSSLGTAERIRSVASIIGSVAVEVRPVVIVSAMQGITDELVQIGNEEDRGKVEPMIASVLNRHLETAAELLTDDELTAYREHVAEVGSRLLQRLVLGVSTEVVRDEVLATGERLSAPLVAACLRTTGVEARSWDASGLIRTDSWFGEASVDFVATAENIRHWYDSVHETAIVTGFIGADANGRTTTLGRGGSDYSAAIFASALGASVLERWTDVDGIYTKDPALDSRARRLLRIPADKAATWNRAGKIGMHREALDPVVRVGIPVHVRSTLTPHVEGTWILPRSSHNAHRKTPKVR